MRAATLFAVTAASLPALPTSGAPETKRIVSHKHVLVNAKTVLLSFQKTDVVEVIEFVSELTGRNFIVPDRLAGKITILSREPILIEDVWKVFVAALDANNLAVYQVGSYWKIVEKKQSVRSVIPTYLAKGDEIPLTEQMVTKLFKVKFVEADQMRNVIAQFTSHDSAVQVFPPDTLIISDVALNVRRIEELIDQLDEPGSSHELHIVDVRYASAQDLARKLTEILQPQSGAGRSVRPSEPAASVASASPAPVQIGRILADERTNKLVVIASAKSFELVTDLLRKLDVPTSDTGVHVYFLKNAKAEDVASTLQSLAQGAAGRRRSGPVAPPAGAGPGVPATPQGDNASPPTAELFSGEVKITADKNTNSLVVLASQSDYRNVVKLVEQLDIPRRQVFIEAVIMEVNVEDNSDIGVSWHAGRQTDTSVGGTSGTAVGVIGSELGGLSSLGGISSLSNLSGFLAGIQGPEFTISGVSIPSFGVVLQALQNSSDVNVISTPHLILTDSGEGEISVGQNVPFQAGFAVNTGSSTSVTTTSLSSLYAPIQRQNVELKLHIRAQINEGDAVRLEVDEQTEEIASVDKTLGPTTSKRGAKTAVVARDEETLVLGGLIQERATRSVSKVPVLGSIPLLGWFFRSESTKKQKTNLLLFLTPYIIRDPSDLRRIFERKMAEHEEYVRRFGHANGEPGRYIDYDNKPGPLARMRRQVSEELGKLENGGPGVEGERLVGSARPVHSAEPPHAAELGPH
jgi:general secretion pathway protein D